MMDLKDQYSHLYGAFVPGDYSLGETLTFDAGQSSGTLIWSYITTVGRFVYVVDDGSGFPIELERNEIVEQTER